MRTLKLAATFLFLLLTECISYAQLLPEKGVPWLNNFTPSQALDKGKIWDIQTAPNGIVYMAADGGLLEYDGIAWKSFRGSNGITRSVLVVSDSMIYTGSDLDFGVWKKINTRNSIMPLCIHSGRKPRKPARNSGISIR